MEIIDAVWEERNLGVTCLELRMQTRDSISDIRDIYSNITEKQYMVVRIPSERFDLVQLFQQKGYQYAETAVTLEHHLKRASIPDRILRVYEKCTWERMNGEDLCQLSEEIYKNIFKTDRVYTDAAFTPYQAAQRYDFWIKDLVSRGEVPYKVMYAGETIGFFLYQEIEKGIFDGLLAASYHAFEGSGMGCCIQYAGIQSAAGRGGHKYLGHVSAGNPAALKSVLSIGFQIKSVEYIFIKHCKGD